MSSYLTGTGEPKLSFEIPDLTRGVRVDSGQEVDILVAVAPYWEISIVFTHELHNKEELADIFKKFIESFHIQ